MRGEGRKGISDDDQTLAKAERTQAASSSEDSGTKNSENLIGSSITNVTPIAYMHFPALGGWRRETKKQLEISPHHALRTPGFKGYADYMMTEQFAEGLRELKKVAQNQRVCFCCAETLWWQCHRRLLSGELLYNRKMEVAFRPIRLGGQLLRVQ